MGWICSMTEQARLLKR